jgi:hypothetical protein
MMLTVAQILRMARLGSKLRSKSVTIIRVKKAVVYNGKTYYVLRCKTKKDQYDTELIFPTDKKITKPNLLRQKMWAHCSCLDFKYRCEYYLAKHGSSTVIDTRGHKPGEGAWEVNPRGLPWVCKHVIQVLNNINRISVKEGKLPFKLAVKLAIPEAEKRIPK